MKCFCGDWAVNEIADTHTSKQSQTKVTEIAERFESHDLVKFFIHFSTEYWCPACDQVMPVV